MFDEEAAAGDDLSDIENRDDQVEPLKEKRVLDLGPFNDEDEDIEVLKSGGAVEEQLKKKKVKKRRVFNENMLTSAAGWHGFMRNSQINASILRVMKQQALQTL